jgi:hypothetical protein
MGAEARRRAADRYRVDVCADTHVRAFEAAIARAGTGTAPALRPAISAGGR